jgi:hypothetical protein
MIKLEVKGVAEVEQMFNRLGKEGGKYFQRALTETAIESVSVMIKESPVLTNRLRSSMHHESPSSRKYVYKDNQGNVFDGKLSVIFTNIGAAFGTNVEYAEVANERSSSPHFFEKAFDFANDKINERLRVNYEKALKELG